MIDWLLSILIYVGRFTKHRIYIDTSLVDMKLSKVKKNHS